MTAKKRRTSKKPIRKVHPKKGMTLADAVMSGINGNALTICPVGYWVAVQLQNPEKTSGGILLPEAEQGDQRWGTVIALGDGEISGGEKFAIPLMENDLVCVAPNRGEPVSVGPFDLLIVNYRDIFFALRDGDHQPLKLD